MRTLTKYVAIAATTGAMLLAGCSTASTDSSTRTSTGTFNTADVEFVQGMIPHHEQAIIMSDMAERLAKDPRVEQLAADIKVAQQPEIDQMKGWLSEWGVDESDVGGHMAMGHGSRSSLMPGMMTSADLDQLSGRTSSAFDTMFLTMMIDHHEGAVEMAKTVKAEGLSPEVATLADAIIVGQTKEIVLMKKWLNA